MHSLDDESEIGIKHGIMGKIIKIYDFTASLDRQAAASIISMADILLSCLLNNLIYGHKLYDFNSGLCGVGWGIEYLIHRGFLSGQSSEIMSELNQHIIMVDIELLTDGELLGIVKYICAHIYVCINQDCKIFYSKKFIKKILYGIYNSQITDICSSEITFLQDIVSEEIAPYYKFDISFITV